MLTLAISGCSLAPPDTSLPQVAGAAAPTGGGTAGALASAATSGSLTDLLTSQLGVSNQQAMGGAGAIFELAKSNMSVADFGKLSSVVPGMSQMLAVAPALSGATGESAGLLGAAASAMGGGSSLGSLATLAGAFQTLGMNSGMASQFLPVVLQYVQGQGGAGTMNLLKAALM